MQANGPDDPGQANQVPPVCELLEDLKGRRAVVTGAARGIGEAVAKWLIMAGAEVTVVDGKITKITDGTGNAAIPVNGFVLSGHGTSRAWLKANATVGASVTLANGTFTLTA